MEIGPAESPRFPGPGSSPQGQSAPKARRKRAADGLRVNIPGPGAESDGVTRKGRPAALWIGRSKRAGRARVKCRAQQPEALRGPPASAGGKGPGPCRREKRLSVGFRAGPYRKPTQVDRSNRPRRSGETTSRNSANQPRNFGRRGAPRGAADLLRRARGSRSEEAQATV